MLGLAAALGFSTGFHPDGGHLREVTLRLDRRTPAPRRAHEENEL
jgi:hypothetical protein